MLRKPLALLSFLAALALTACDEGNTSHLNTGDIAPAFAASSLGAVPFKFPEDLRGKPVVIRFWADWCRFCEGEMKAIERVWQRHKDQGLMVVAVNAGQNRQDVADFISKICVTYPALLDEKAIINFLNDLLAFYLIRVHWDLITQRWLREPLKFRYAWLTIFYPVFLLVRYRKSSDGK